MARETVVLETEQWTQLIGILTSAPVPWTISNPLIQGIAPQLQAQRDASINQPQGSSNGHLDTQRGSPFQPNAPVVHTVGGAGKRDEGT